MKRNRCPEVKLGIPKPTSGHRKLQAFSESAETPLHIAMAAGLKGGKLAQRPKEAPSCPGGLHECGGRACAAHAPRARGRSSRRGVLPSQGTPSCGRLCMWRASVCACVRARACACAFVGVRACQQAATNPTLCPQKEIRALAQTSCGGEPVEHSYHNLL